MEKRGPLREGERKNVAVLFADMTGSTTIAKQLDPEELDSLMTRLFTRFETVVREYGGDVEKYIGDAMVAVFGARITHEDDARRAVNAGLELLEQVRLTALEERFSAIDIDFRIGINSGLTATGRRGEFDVVTGDTMNLASRLESAAEPGTVLISESVYAECGNHFEIASARTLSVQGMNEPITVYTVTGRKDDALVFRGPFVGREDICSRILGAYLKHDQTSTSGFIISSDAGMGKSRLIAELISRIRSFPNSNPPVLYVRTKVNRSTRYTVIRELLGNYLSIGNNDGYESIRSRVMSALGADEEVAHMFARYMLGETDDIPEGRLFVYLHLVLGSIVKTASGGPFSPIIYLDNYQFIDQESMNFFRFFLQGALIKPFFLFAGRPESHEIMKVFPQLEHIKLQPLSKDVASDLISELWEGDCPPETRSGIVENAAGVPLFIEEYVRYMEHHDDPHSLPPTVQNIFLSRIEGYEEGMRDLIKKLSVFRQDFSEADAAVVQEETRGDPAIVPPVLGFFIREGILRLDGTLYRFRHEAFKRTLYESLLNYNKKIIHRIIAKHLESTQDPNTPGLLYHYSRAGEFDEIERILLSSPDRWTDLGFLVYFDQLLDQRRGATDVEYLQLLFYKSAVLLNNGRTADAEDTVREIVRIGISRRSTEYLAKAYHLMLGYYLRSGDLDKVRFFGQKALNNYQLANIGDKAIENVLYNIAVAELEAGNFDANQTVIDSMKPVRSDDGWCARDIALLQRDLALGKYAEVIETARTRLRGVVQTYSLDEPDLQGILCQTYWHACDFEQAGEAAENALASGAPPEYAAASFYSMISAAAFIAGNMDRYSRNMQQAIYYLSRVVNEHDRVDASATIAKALYLAKDFDRFLDITEKALTIGLCAGPMRPTFSLLVMCAEYSLDRADPEAAEFYLREADWIEQRNMLLTNKDRILYFHLWSLLTQGDESELLRQHAVECLRSELDNLYDESLKDRLLSLRGLSSLLKTTNENSA